MSVSFGSCVYWGYMLSKICVRVEMFSEQNYEQVSNTNPRISYDKSSKFSGNINL